MKTSTKKRETSKMHQSTNHYEWTSFWPFLTWNLQALLDESFFNFRLLTIRKYWKQKLNLPELFAKLYLPKDIKLDLLEEWLSVYIKYQVAMLRGVGVEANFPNLVPVKLFMLIKLLTSAIQFFSESNISNRDLISNSGYWNLDEFIPETDCQSRHQEMYWTFQTYFKS